MPQVGILEEQQLSLDEGVKDKVTLLLHLLQNLDSVTKSLQGSCTDLANSHILFEKVMKKHPCTRSRFGMQASVVENPTHKIAVAKVHDSKENALTPSKCSTIQHLLLNLTEDKPVEQTSSLLLFSERLLKRHRLDEQPGMSRYLDLRVVLHVIDCHRKGALPSSIVSQLFQNVNVLY